MRKVIVCLVLSSMLFMSGCAGYIVSALTKPKDKSKLPVKTVTVTLNKTTQEEVIAVLGKPSHVSNDVEEKHLKTEINYNAHDDKHLFETTVCNENNQCASNGKQTSVTYTFKDNKFIHISENYNP